MTIAILLCALLLTVILLIISLSTYEDGKEYIFVFIAIMTLLIISGIFVFQKEQEFSYKQGQIDCLNGKIKYELVKQPDGTTEWKEKKEG